MDTPFLFPYKCRLSFSIISSALYGFGFVTFAPVIKPADSCQGTHDDKKGHHYNYKYV